MKYSHFLFALIVAIAATPVFAGYTVTTLGTFDLYLNGDQPVGGLVLSGSTLYGTTTYGGYGGGAGTVFSEPVTGGTPTVIGTFSSTTVATPQPELVLSNGILYGVASSGGAYNNGAVFSLPVTGGNGTPTVLASFNNTNGAEPGGGLVLSRNGTTLYGTTLYGGGNNAGTVFSVPIAGGSVTTLATFGNNLTDGANPYGRLVLSSNGTMLYGTTEVGGNGFGTVFAVPVTSVNGNVTTLASFDYTNGYFPMAGLTLSANGTMLYGTAAQGGGINDVGTVFQVPVTGGDSNLTAMATFNGTNGADPQGSLLDIGGKLYGTTTSGGDNNAGTVFSIPDTGGTLTTLLSPDATNNGNPEGDLIADGNGNLYGTSEAGGSQEDGTVFMISVPEPATLALLTLGGVGLLARRRRK